MFIGCGEVVQVPVPRNVSYANLTDEQIDYIERFNVTARSIEKYPPHKAQIEKDFYIFSNVTNIKDAKYLIFAERHNNSAGQTWTAGIINELISKGDIILFEGNQAGLQVRNLTEHMITDIFAAREFELRKTKYKPTSLSKLKDKFDKLFRETKDFLMINILNFYKAKGFFWDLRQGSKLHENLTKRNEKMVETMTYAGQGANKVFVIAGALHTPHYEFAHHQRERSFKKGSWSPYLNMDYYRSIANEEGKGSTKVIFEFLMSVESYAVLIPKNYPGISKYEPFFPRNDYRNPS